MAKLALYFDEAQRLYVQEGLSLDAIVNILGGKVSRKTLYNWKVKGDWDTKRKQYLKDTEDLYEQLLKLAKLTLKEALNNPTPHNIYAVMKAVGALKAWQGVKIIEEEIESQEQTKSVKDKILEALAEAIK